MALNPKKIELKISIAAEAARRAKRQLGLKDGEAQRATIWFCEQPAANQGAVRLELFERGVIVRLRNKLGGDSDATVKFRRDAPLALPTGWNPAPASDFKVEGDWTTQSRKVAASLTSTVDGAVIEAAGGAGPPLPDGLFSPEHRQFVAALLAPRQIDLRALRPLGPIAALRWEETPRADLGEKLGAEHWKVDGLEFLELSMRVSADSADAWQRTLVDWATHQDFDIASVGITKTQAVLEHLMR